ncbi:MAG: T9SS type A sorting domain-containing protein, partial [Bacteroidota bacterium]|nr:T9SS type A sorting domain-containing protein [Bacteroidota bacterium]
ANNDGAGYFQIRKPSGAPLAGFDSDFGDQITHYFTVGYGLSNELNHTHSSLRCFPNPANSEINVELSGFTGQIEVEVLDALHKSVRSKKVYVNLFTKQINFNISSLNAGLYFIKATDDYHSKIIKFLHE